MNFFDKLLILFLTVVVVLAFPLVWMLNAIVELGAAVKSRYAAKQVVS